MPRKDERSFSGAAFEIGYDTLGKLRECSSTGEGTDEPVTYTETIRPVTAESILGKEVRSDWLPLTRAHGILLDGISPNDIGADEYSRVRSFLFDSGYVPINRKLADQPRAHVGYGRSDLLSNPSAAGTSSRNNVSM